MVEGRLYILRQAVLIHLRSDVLWTTFIHAEERNQDSIESNCHPLTLL